MPRKSPNDLFEFSSTESAIQWLTSAAGHSDGSLYLWIKHLRKVMDDNRVTLPPPAIDVVCSPDFKHMRNVQKVVLTVALNNSSLTRKRINGLNKPAKLHSKELLDRLRKNETSESR